MRGVLVNIFPTTSEYGKGSAAALTLTEEPTVKVIHKDPDSGREETLKPKVGETVNVGLGAADLKRKVDAKLIGEEIGIAYVDDLEVPNGTMRVYVVKVFEQ